MILAPLLDIFQTIEDHGTMIKDLRFCLTYFKLEENMHCKKRFALWFHISQPGEDHESMKRDLHIC
jgi:hypothetical protein